MTYEQIKLYEANNRVNPQKRKASVYSDVLIENGHFKDGLFKEYGGKKWYWFLEGEIIFCELIIINDKLHSIYPVQLSGSKKFRGRDVALEDVVIL